MTLESRWGEGWMVGENEFLIRLDMLIDIYDCALPMCNMYCIIFQGYNLIITIFTIFINQSFKRAWLYDRKAIFKSCDFLENCGWRNDKYSPLFKQHLKSDPCYQSCMTRVILLAICYWNNTTLRNMKQMSC